MGLDMTHCNWDTPSMQLWAITISFHHTSLITLPRQLLFQGQDTLHLLSQDQHPCGIQQELIPLTKHSGTSWGFLYFQRAHKIWLRFSLKSIFTLFSFRKTEAVKVISFVKCIKLFSWIIWNNRWLKKNPYQLQRKIGRNEKNSWRLEIRAFKRANLTLTIQNHPPK